MTTLITMIAVTTTILMTTSGIRYAGAFSSRSSFAGRSMMKIRQRATSSGAARSFSHSKVMTMKLATAIVGLPNVGKRSVTFNSSRSTRRRSFNIDISITHPSFKVHFLTP